MSTMRRFEELKLPPLKLHRFLLKARACAAYEGYQPLLQRGATEFSACLRFREKVCASFLCAIHPIFCRAILWRLLHIACL